MAFLPLPLAVQTFLCFVYSNCCRGQLPRLVSQFINLTCSNLHASNGDIRSGLVQHAVQRDRIFPFRTGTRELVYDGESQRYVVNVSKPTWSKSDVVCVEVDTGMQLGSHRSCRVAVVIYVHLREGHKSSVRNHERKYGRPTAHFEHLVMPYGVRCHSLLFSPLFLAAPNELLLM